MTTQPVPNSVSNPILPLEFVEPRWYAVHTYPRHEKRVAEQFKHKCIDSFLPLYRTVHRWRDRRVELEVPLFPGYVFVHTALKHRLQIAQVPSVVRFVSFGPSPTPIPDTEIETLRNGLASGAKAEPHPYLKLGCRVRIECGPLKGAEGVLVRKKDNLRVVLSVDLIMRSIAVEVDESDIAEL